MHVVLHTVFKVLRSPRKKTQPFIVYLKQKSHGGHKTGSLDPALQYAPSMQASQSSTRIFPVLFE